MNGLLGAQLGAQSGMASGGVMGYADLIRKKLMETIAPKSAETLKEETPQPTAQKDYTAGLTPPEIGGVPSKLEFKATPNRLSAFMVALGQIMQNKYNTERAKEEQAQGLYESKLKSGQALNQQQELLAMKQAADEANPDMLLDRSIKQEQLKQYQAMTPIKIETAQARLQRALGMGGGKSSGGGSKTMDDIMGGGAPSSFKAFIERNAEEFDPNTKQPIITPEVVKKAYQQYLLTNPNARDRTAADKFVSTYSDRPTRQISPEREVYNSFIAAGMEPAQALNAMKAAGYKNIERITQEEQAKAVAVIDAMKNYGKEPKAETPPPAPKTSTVAPNNETPEQKRLREYKASRGLN